MSRQRPPHCPVIVLGTGETAIGTIRSLRRAGIRVAYAKKKTDLAAWSRHDIGIDNWPAKVLSADALGQWLESSELTAAVLMPCSDAWVRSVSRLDAAIARRFRRWTPSPAAVDIMIDKNRFRSVLEKLGLPHPKSYALERDRDAWQVPDSVFESAFLKPHDSLRFFGEFGVKAWFAADRDDALRKARTVWEKDMDLLIQEYIPGPAHNHFFIDGFRSKDGSVNHFLARQRLRMYPRDFGNSTSMKTVPLDSVSPALETLTALIRHTDFHGIFSAEFKRDQRDNVLRIIEVNCRPWWFVDYADRCGLRVCNSAYRDALGLDVPTHEPYRLDKLGTYPIYDWKVFQTGSDRSFPRFVAMIVNWMRSYQPIFMWSDPIPAMVNFLRLLKTTLQRRVRHIVKTR